ncbi:MAG TPA: uracil-DNA glycosylase family protein [Burkholderiaceae bacterium]|nr:uracil-DNA glycosylase family protein [Burkholderiaceae bacterium]
MKETTAQVLALIRACQVCAAHLPQPPRPVLQAGAGARLLIVGQAPGLRAHDSGTPWNDPSGEVLRAWLGVSREAFYDADRIALVPTGFCYPGTVNGADLPPRPECAPLWHARLLATMPAIRLTLLVGGWAQRHHLGTRDTVAATVAAYRAHLPGVFPLPHPSWRNRAWAARHPWFEAEVLPALRCSVAQALAG